MAKVFLSYSTNDEAFARKLYDRLTGDGVDCFFAPESIKPGEKWMRRLQDEAKACEVLIAVLSAHFVESEWTEAEWASAQGKTIIPIRLSDCEAPPFLNLRQAVDATTDARFAANYPRILTVLGCAKAASSVDRNTLPPVRPIPPHSYMPHASMREGFVGRVAELWTVHDQLRTRRTSVVSGAGGMGKTQTAIEYVHRFNDHYPGGVFWIDCEQGIQRLIEVLERHLDLRVDGKLPVRDQLAFIWGAVAQRPAMLVVLDNFLEDVAIREWLPVAANVCALVTTRRTDLRRLAGVPLPVMSADEGQRLLGVISDDARALVEEVGGLPLALELLRAQLAELPVGDVLNAVRGGAVATLERFADDYREELPDGHARSIAATFQASWDKATEDGREVLRVMSHLAPAPVPLRLLRAVLKWEETDAITDRLRRAVADLARLSLVERVAEGQPVAHRLFLGFVGSLSSAERLAAPVLTAIDQEMLRTRDDQDTASYRELEAILAHAHLVMSRMEQSEVVGISLAKSLFWHHDTLGRFQLARKYSEEALARAERLYPSSHPEIASAQSNLARVLRSVGELEGARDLRRKALASDERSFPAGHPEIAIKQSNLAVVLQDLGELGEARDLLRKALAAAEESYPAGHPKIAIRQSNLAMVLRELGELKEARDLLQNALAADEQSYPAGHPMIAIRQSNLAVVLQDLGELKEARDMLRRALAADEHTYPAGHPEIALRQSNLAEVLRGLGEVDEARYLAQVAYSATLAAYGSDHPRVRRFKARLDSYSPSA